MNEHSEQAAETDLLLGQAYHTLQRAQNATEDANCQTLSLLAMAQAMICIATELETVSRKLEDLSASAAALVQDTHESAQKEGSAEWRFHLRRHQNEYDENCSYCRELKAET